LLLFPESLSLSRRPIRLPSSGIMVPLNHIRATGGTDFYGQIARKVKKLSRPVTPHRCPTYTGQHLPISADRQAQSHTRWGPHPVSTGS
jgi:hypothetical protein